MSDEEDFDESFQDEATREIYKRINNLVDLIYQTKTDIGLLKLKNIDQAIPKAVKVGHILRDLKDQPLGIESKSTEAKSLDRRARDELYRNIVAKTDLIMTGITDEDRKLKILKKLLDDIEIIIRLKAPPKGLSFKDQLALGVNLDYKPKRSKRRDDDD